MIKKTSILTFAVIGVIAFVACKGKETKTEAPKTPALDSAILIKGPCAVFVSPDTLEIDSLTKVLGEDDFYTVADDYVFYLGNAKSYLDSAGINVISTVEDTLKFLMNSGSVYIVPSKDSSSIYPVYFFNGNEPPLQVEVMDDYKTQFEKVFMKK